MLSDRSISFSDRMAEFWREDPQRTALTLLAAGQPDRAVTRTELMDGAAAWAGALAQAGVQPGDVVILIQQHGLDLVLAYWGAVLRGAVPAIMPFLTEKLLPERYRVELAALAAVTTPAAFVTYPEFESEVRAALSAQACVLTPAVLASGGTVVFDPANSLCAGLHRDPGETALLQHSSGTTGLQKGVALSHQAVFNQLESYRKAIHLTSQDVIVSWLPLYHDMGLIACFLMPLLLGVPLVLMSPFEWVRAPARLLQAVSRFRGTLSWLPNFAYNFCAQKIRDRELEGLDLSSWRAVINCSEPMRAASQRGFAQRFERLGLRADALATCYAMAENTFAVTQGGIDAPAPVDLVDQAALQEERWARPAREDFPALEMLSAGTPVEGTAVRVVDEAGLDLPERRVGEIALLSNCMLKEYYRRPDATEKAFHAGWYLTGDYGYLAEGDLYIVGRKKDLIIVGGKNVYPQDLEALAMQAGGVHPGRVAAFGVYNEAGGTEDVVLVAEVDTQDAAQRAAISAAVRDVVTRGSAVAPREVYIVDRGWLVKTSSGKTARAANRDRYLAETAL
jgi:acyl-CoA synthetase (AMP-forming)/AMP-acid ligase II